jgi:chromosome segregation ATPase
MEHNEKFVSAYIDSALGLLHQNINNIVELKARIKILEDVVHEKNDIITKLDGTIGALNDEKKNIAKTIDDLYLEKEKSKVELSEKNSNLIEVIRTLKEKLKTVEDKYEIFQQKSTHMSTYETQIKEMKKEIIAKNEEIEKLKNSSKNPDINNTDIKINSVKKVQKKAEIIDDF